MNNVDPKRYQDAQDKKNRQSVNVAALVKVTAFNAAAMTVDVQPLSQHLENGEYQSQPPILGVPCSFTKSGGFIIRPWIKAGDVGLVVYIDHDIDKAVADGQESKPNTERNHSTSDAVYIGGIVTGNAPVGGLPDGAAVIGTEDGSTYIAVAPGTITLVGTVEIQGDVHATGDATVDGSMTTAVDTTASGISLANHVHGGVESGSGNTGKPQ